MKIDRILFKLATVCTLKCEKCGEFNPYLQEKGKPKFYDAELVCRDIDKLAACASSIEVIQLSGGECLLHPQILKILKHLGENPKFKNICIFSNATFAPKEDVLKVMVSLGDRFSLDISNYSVIGIDSAKVTNVYDQYKIPYRILDIPFWADHSDISCKNLDIDGLKKVAVDCCGFNTTTVMFSVIDGKVSSHCCTGGSIMYFLDLYKEMPSCYVDLRECEANGLEEKLKALFDADYMQACNYCLPDHLKEHIPVAVQIPTKIEVAKPKFSFKNLFGFSNK